MKIISGMHRSGTSLVARLCFEAGAPMGDAESFYRPDRWNPEGYYERPEVHAVNMPLLHGRIGRLSYFKLPSERTILGRGRRMGARLDRVIDLCREAVVKDCRFCITLPAWLERGAPVERVLLCLRDPVSVAGSLRRRNRASRRLSYHLWRVHNERLLEACAGVPVWYLYYPNLLRETSFVREAGAALSFLGLEAGAEKLRRLRERCVRPGMDHHPPGEEEYPEAVERLWKELRSRCRDQFRTEAAS